MQIGSNFDVSSIVSQLVTLERQPTQDRIESTLRSISLRLSSMGQLKSAISDFTDNINSLREGHDLKGVEFISSNEDLAYTLTDDYVVTTGQYAMELTKRADRDSFTTQTSRWSDEMVGTGSFTITNDSGKTITVDINADESSLSDIANAINQQGRSMGVQASILNVRAQDGRYEQHLLVQSREIGADNGFTINSGDAAYQFLATDQMNQVSTAQDATLKMGGLAFTSTTNTFSGAIQGIDIDVANLSEGDTVDLQIKNLIEPIKEATQSFVDGFNKILSMVNSGNNDIDTSLSLQIRNELRRSVNEQVMLSDGSYSSLSQAGITTDAKTGQLVIDDKKIEAFIKENPQGMDELLAGEEGVLSRLEERFNSMIETDGLIASRISSLNQQQDRINDQQESLDRRMYIYERLVSAQYMQLEQVINSLSDNNSVISSLYA